MGEQEYIISLPVTVQDRTGQGINSVEQNLDRGRRAWQRFKQELGGGTGGSTGAATGKLNVAINAIDKATAKARSIVNGIKSAVSRPFSFVLNVVDRASAPIRGIFHAITAPLQGLIGQLLVMTGLAGGIGAVIGAGVKASGLSATMEQTNMAFETMLRSKTAAQGLIKDMQNLANLTPFEFPDLAQSARLLLAFKFGAKDIVPMMTSIGDASSGLGAGAQGIERIVRGLGQMKAKGKVSAEELLQLTEVGIPALSYLSEKYKLTAKDQDDINKALKKRGVTTEQAISTILAGMEKDFGGMMSKQSRTMNGLMSTIKDTFSDKMLRRFGDGLNNAIKPRIEKIADFLANNPKLIEDAGKALDSLGNTIAEKVLQPAEKFGKLFMDTVNSPEFKNAATLGDKAKILWDKVIVEPFTAWWQKDGKTKVAKMAGDLGSGLAGGIMSIFGISLKEDNPAVQAGKDIADAFAKGFSEKFSFQKILESDIGKIAVPVLGALLAGKLLLGVGEALGKLKNFFPGTGKAGQTGSPSTPYSGPSNVSTMNVTANIVNVYGKSVNDAGNGKWNGPNSGNPTGGGNPAGGAGAGSGNLPSVVPGGGTPSTSTGGGNLPANGKTPINWDFATKGGAGAAGAAAAMEGFAWIFSLLGPLAPAMVDQFQRQKSNKEYQDSLTPAQKAAQDLFNAQDAMNNAQRNANTLAPLGPLGKWIGEVTGMTSTDAAQKALDAAQAAYDALQPQMTDAGTKAAAATNSGYSGGQWAQAGADAFNKAMSGFNGAANGSIPGGIAGINDTTKHAYGGRFTREQYGTIAEGGQEEYVIPTASPSRGREVLGQAAEALGVRGGSGGGPSVQIFINGANMDEDEIANVIATKLEGIFGNTPIIQNG